MNLKISFIKREGKSQDTLLVNFVLLKVGGEVKGNSGTSMEVSVEREVICKGATNNVVLRFSLDLGCLSGKAVVSGLADYSMHVSGPCLELKDQVEAALDAVFSRSGDHVALELDEEEVGLYLEMVEPLVAEIAVLKRNGSPALAASDLGSIKGGIMRHEGNLAALYLHADLGDVGGSGFAARALEESVQLNIGRG